MGIGTEAPFPVSSQRHGPGRNLATAVFTERMFARNYRRIQNDSRKVSFKAKPSWKSAARVGNRRCVFVTGQRSIRIDQRLGNGHTSATPPHEVFLGQEEVSDVSLSTFYIFDKENAAKPQLGENLLSWGCGGCRCGDAGDAGAAGACASYRLRWRL